jgi:hypothetical protein
LVNVLVDELIISNLEIKSSGNTSIKPDFNDLSGKPFAINLHLVNLFKRAI